jgi:formylglycine-generating enzyme required for sulfatase activity
MKFFPRTLYLLLVVLMLWATDGSCSGVNVTNTSLGTRDAGTGNAPINFDISWDNSWRSTGGGAPAPNNWDAAWVFVKFQKNGGDWQHASLNNTGHTVPSGASLDVGLVDTSASFNISTNPGVGVFIYRSADGTGTFSKTGFSLSWKYTQDGVGVNDTIVLRVYAIEMVYVPAGAFFAGDNATADYSFKQGSADTDPWFIGSEGAIVTSNGAGTGTGLSETAAEFYYPGRGDATGSIFTIPAAFPKGYQAHYVMKGEISQRQWVSFFNTLTATQKSSRDVTSSSWSGKNSDNLSYRNNVSWTSGDATLPDRGGGATYEHVAMNFISWADITAYFDWSGLRPMSELEFERSGRGPYRAVSGEYAWGTASNTNATSISSSGLPNERAQSGANAYVNYTSILGPFRVGSFADGVATRTAAGAGYYGAMDLSGNLWEFTIPVGNSTARSFEGRYHGSGMLDSNGHHNVTSWPAFNDTGWGLRGGSWQGGSPAAQLSDRWLSLYSNTHRFTDTGGRGVRSAP